MSDILCVWQSFVHVESREARSSGRCQPFSVGAGLGKWRLECFEIVLPSKSCVLTPHEIFVCLIVSQCLCLIVFLVIVINTLGVALGRFRSALAIQQRSRGLRYGLIVLVNQHPNQVHLYIYRFVFMKFVRLG